MNPPELSIRHAGVNDAELLASWAQTMAMETEHKQLDGDTVLKGVQAGIADPKRARYFIAMSGNRPAGTLMLTTEWSDWRNGNWWWIQSVYVDADARGQGGTDDLALFQAAEHARDRFALFHREELAAVAGGIERPKRAAVPPPSAERD